MRMLEKSYNAPSIGICRRRFPFWRSENPEEKKLRSKHPTHNANEIKYLFRPKKNFLRFEESSELLDNVMRKFSN